METTTPGCKECGMAYSFFCSAHRSSMTHKDCRWSACRNISTRSACTCECHHTQEYVGSWWVSKFREKGGETDGDN